MRAKAAELFRGFWIPIAVWVEKEYGKCRRCRECDAEIVVSETICPRCGAAEPSRVSKPALAVLIAIAALFCLTAILIFR